MISLLAELLNSVFPTEVNLKLLNQQKTVAEIVEVLNVTQHIHRNLLDLFGEQLDKWDSKEQLDLLQGNKISILFGDFMFTVALSMMANLYNNGITKLVTEIVEGLSSGLYTYETSYDHIIQRVSITTWQDLNYEIAGINMENGCRALLELLPNQSVNYALKDLVGEFGKNFFFAWQTSVEMQQFREFVSSNKEDSDNAAADAFDLLSAPIILDASDLPELVRKVHQNRKTEQQKPTISRQLLSQHFDFANLDLSNSQKQMQKYADTALNRLQMLSANESHKMFANLIRILRVQ